MVTTVSIPEGSKIQVQSADERYWDPKNVGKSRLSRAGMNIARRETTNITVYGVNNKKNAAPEPKFYVRKQIRNRSKSLR